MRNKIVFWASLAFLALGCGFGPVVIAPVDPTPITEISPDASPPPPAEQPPENVAPTATPEPTATPSPTPTPGPPTPTRYFLQSLSTCPSGAATDKNGECCPHQYEVDPITGFCTPAISYGEDAPPPTPRNGLIIALVLPLLCLGLPWMLGEAYFVRYVRPKGLDLSTVRIKAQDGLFIEATISLTARKVPGITSLRTTWSSVQEFVEKPLEQELIHRAIQYPTLEELEQGLKDITDSFKDMPVVRELLDDFGVEVMRFNIEARYHQETMDALNRKAEATAGGSAYLAFAAAAHLDPESPECRELYRVYQETTGRVDAARNLGGGLTLLAETFVHRSGQEEASDSDAS